LTVTAIRVSEVSRVMVAVRMEFAIATAARHAILTRDGLRTTNAI